MLKMVVLMLLAMSFARQNLVNRLIEPGYPETTD